jgi:Pyruvate/2-oxoacid:ferredoxin oxidoreductase delta subunit
MLMEKKKIESVKQLPVMPLTIEDMTWNKTGTWRLLTPEAQDKTPPCRAACPIGQPIAELIQAVRARNWNLALERLLEANPLPGVTGRLCYHPCQAKCLRNDLDRPVSVQELEKAVADLGKTPKVAKDASAGRKVAVCGAGPAGLTASYHLALQGCQVTVFDPDGPPGGFLKDVRPEKLPPEVLEREISRLASISGVQFRMKAASLDADQYDLTIVDRTAYKPGSEEARAVEALMSGGGHRLDIEIQKGFSGFKAVQVAHAVALGRRIASEACRHLNLNFDEINQSLGRVATKEDMKFYRLPDKISADFLARAEDTGDEEAVLEAGRCLSCGTCNLCQSCVLACPDACCRLDEEEGKIVIDLYHCKGCGICAYECPRGVLGMEDLP